MTRALRRSFLLTLTAASLIAACGDAASTTSGESTLAGAPGTAAATSGTTGATTGPLPAGCAPADGSAAKQQQFAAAPPVCLQKGTSYSATIETNHGTLHVTLRADIAPMTVNSFVNLARFHYFDGTTCHRAIQGFVVQCGDPTATGTGGPGYEFGDELPTEPYVVGSIAMANAGPNTNGSQFFIISGPDGAALPPNYSLFGQVVDADLGVVAGLDALGNPSDGGPLQPIDIVSVTITEP
jgi:cyclophilin family peptidyl-prolyl cis-trans isomerase